MGARISINLADLVMQPDVELTMRTETIEIGDNDPHYHTYADLMVNMVKIAEFDVVVLDGVVTLEKDWNFFRDSPHHTKLMRALFETSTPFHVIP